MELIIGTTDIGKQLTEKDGAGAGKFEGNYMFGASRRSIVLGPEQEWDTYRSGVFTHEVLSALRGAADIDGDRLIEYSELAAFLAAANRSVLDPRARTNTLVRAPERYPHAAVVALTSPRRPGRRGRVDGQGVDTAAVGPRIGGRSGTRVVLL